ncbi:MAG: hypothetical protein JWN13_211 [Betaproteobacteria bacterium]|nr:hypothetical protein [Betaproteobacteria bacterium]
MAKARRVFHEPKQMGTSKVTRAEARLQQGIEFHRAGMLTQAEFIYRDVLAQSPRQFDCLHYFGALQCQIGQYESGAKLIRRAIKIRPDWPVLHYNLALALQRLNHPEEALVCFNRALRLKPDYVEALLNRGVTLHALKRPGEALVSFERALVLKPSYADAHWNEGLCQLLTGNFERGWQKLEWRWQHEKFEKARRDFPQPLWTGEQSIAQKTILLHAEQGLGDTVQFCRYVRLVASKGTDVLLEVQPSLKSLLARLDNDSKVFARGEVLPAFDYHCPLLSLPLAFKTRLDTIPANVPYLSSDPTRVKKWQAKLGQKRALRVGLAWCGSKDHANDANRSIRLNELAKLLSARAQFVSLQKEVRAPDEVVLKMEKDLLHFGHELTDFADTAALVELMDLVITVDTAVAHVAGALGKPVWILLPFAPDWRWLLDRDDSPWYPTSKLFRQSVIGDWAGVITRVNNELCALRLRA